MSDPLAESLIENRRIEGGRLSDWSSTPYLFSRCELVNVSLEGSQLKGVRFVEVEHGGWDNHRDIYTSFGDRAGQLTLLRAIELDSSHSHCWYRNPAKRRY